MLGGLKHAIPFVPKLGSFVDMQDSLYKVEDWNVEVAAAGLSPNLNVPETRENCPGFI